MFNLGTIALGSGQTSRTLGVNPDSVSATGLLPLQVFAWLWGVVAYTAMGAVGFILFVLCVASLKYIRHCRTSRKAPLSVQC